MLHMWETKQPITTLKGDYFQYIQWFSLFVINKLCLQHRPIYADLGIRSAGPLRTRNR